MSDGIGIAKYVNLCSIYAHQRFASLLTTSQSAKSSETIRPEKLQPNLLTITTEA